LFSATNNHPIYMIYLNPIPTIAEEILCLRQSISILPARQEDLERKLVTDS